MTRQRGVGLGYDDRLGIKQQQNSFGRLGCAHNPDCFRGDEKGTNMLHHSGGARAVGQIGLCFASVSSFVVLVGPASAAAHEVSHAYQDRDGKFTVALSGREVPGGGDPVGQGSAQLNLQQQTACFTINWKGLQGEVTALHLHAAASGSEGPHWIDFFNGQHFPGAQSESSGCVPTTQDKIHAVIDNPTAYYLNAHSTAFPKGAIRGQLN